MKKILLFVSTFALTSSLFAQQIPNYIPTTSLLMWVPFDGNFDDISSSPNNITNNGVTLMADRNGVPNSAGSFNGTGAYMTAPIPTFTFAQTDSFTYSVWVKKESHTSAGTNADIALMTATNATGAFISLISFANNSSGMNFGINKQQSAWTWTAGTYTLSTWDHYLATYQGGAMALYKNGNQIATNTYSLTGSIAMNIPFNIGKGLANVTLKGGIDDIAVWGRVLNAQEINDVYSNVFTGVKALDNTSSSKVFPNPAQNFLNVSNNSSYAIKNILGAEVASGKADVNGLISIEDLNPGVYFIQFNNDHTAIRFIKE